MTEKKIRFVDISTARWEPWSGCEKVSDGCRSCWAKRSVAGAKRMGKEPFASMDDPFHFVIHEEQLENPEKLPFFSEKSEFPERIWLCDRSDPFFDKKVEGEYVLPDDYIIRSFDIMAQIPHHRFIVCTKRSGRMSELDSSLNWKPWIWAAVTVESEKYMHRIEHLKDCRAQRKMLHFEPLLSEIPDFDPSGIDFIAVGGEAGKMARPLEEGWVIKLRDIAAENGIPFLFKSWSAHGTKGGRGGKVENLLLGKRYMEFPEDLVNHFDFNEGK